MQYITTEGEFHPYDSTKPAYLPEGSVILTPDEATHFAMNIMPVYRNHMMRLAREMRSGAVAIEQAPPKGEPTPGTIDLTPHPRGLLMMADQFDRQVNAAQELMAALQGPE